MGAAKGKAVVEQDPPIRYVGCSQRSREFLAKILAQRKVKCCVAREMVRWGIAVGESRPIVHVGRHIAPPREVHRAADVQGVSLIVVEKKETTRRRKISKA